MTFFFLVIYVFILNKYMCNHYDRPPQMLGTRITAPSLKHFAYSFRKTRRQINEGKQFSDDKCDGIKQSDVGTLEGVSLGWERLRRDE